ncbi:MAG: hypothetical protein H6935_15240 [Thiobacillus sp.]|nr:hypothetical protein [Thiobacillus sp.]
MNIDGFFQRKPGGLYFGSRLSILAAIFVALAAIISSGNASAQQEVEISCGYQDPRSSSLWHNFEAFVNREYLSGPVPDDFGLDDYAHDAWFLKRRALAYGHGLHRAELAAADDFGYMEAVACLHLGVDQIFGLEMARNPWQEHDRVHKLRKAAARGKENALVEQYTGVKTVRPAYEVLGITPSKPSSRHSLPAKSPAQQVQDGQYCATIKADTDWQAVAIPKGFNGVIQVEGSWNVHDTHATVGPEGYSGSLGDRMDRQYPHAKHHRGLPFAALLMRNGSHGPVSWVRVRKHMGIATGPDFQFRINEQDDALADNKGALTVCMSVGQHGIGGNAKPNPTPVPVSAASCFLSYEDWSISEADRLTTRAERMERGVETCYSTEDHRKCRQAADLAHSALVHITQWFARTRDIDGHCLLCDLTEVSPKPSAIGARLDELSYKLFRKGLGSNIGSGWGGQYADFEKEDLCVLNKPRKGGLSISPVAKDDCPKHCADAAPNCKYAYYNDKTRTCSWDDDQSTPNLTALKSGDIWDGAKRRWLGHAGNASLSGNRVFVLDKVVFSKYQTPTDICGATMTCKHEKRALPGNRTLGGTETEDYYSISEGSASFRFKESFRTGGQSLSNYSAQFTFEAPPPRIRPGETLRLRTQGNIIGFIDGRGYTRSFAYYIKRGGQNSYFDKTQVALGTGELPLQGNRRNGQLSKSSTTAITIPASARKELIIGGKFGPDPGLYVDWIYKEQ